MRPDAVFGDLPGPFTDVLLADDERTNLDLLAGRFGDPVYAEPRGGHA